MLLPHSLRNNSSQVLLRYKVAESETRKCSMSSMSSMSLVLFTMTPGCTAGEANPLYIIGRQRTLCTALQRQRRGPQDAIAVSSRT